MSGVDLTDQFLQYYSFLHKSVKWLKKFFVHCLNMVILNAHILHKKYSDSKIKSIKCLSTYTQCTYSPQEIFRQQNKALAVQDTTSKAHVE